MKPKLIIVTGPTAVGKTDLSVALAKRINGEIISADSMQVYKHMNIGTAKITKEEMQGVPHFLIDELEPTEDFNVVLFQELALKYMKEIYERNHIPIIVGGTGFYIQAVLSDIDFKENDEDNSIRLELMQIAKEKGASYLHDMLRRIDEKSAETIHENNVKRVIRAIEFYRQTGLKMSEHNEEQRQNESPYDYQYFVLTNDRQVLYERIEQRIDKMLEAGLVDEVKSLVDAGLDKRYISMQGIGYKEIIDYLNGDISYEEAVYILKRDTRHFAKRQLTWFKREKDVIWMDYSEYDNDKNKILEAMIKKIGEHYGDL